MKLARSILNVLAVIFVTLQVFGYLGLMTRPSPEVTGLEALAYYIGLNFLLIFGGICFLVARLLAKQIRKREQVQLVDSIGLGAIYPEQESSSLK